MLEGFVVVVDGFLEIAVLSQVEGALVEANQEIGGGRTAVA